MSAPSTFQMPPDDVCVTYASVGRMGGKGGGASVAFANATEWRSMLLAKGQKWRIPDPSSGPAKDVKPAPERRI